MTSKKYVYSKEKNTPRSRVNVWQLNKTVQAQARNIQLLQRAISHQANVNAQQVLLNESLVIALRYLKKNSGHVNKAFSNALHGGSVNK